MPARRSLIAALGLGIVGLLALVLAAQTPPAPEPNDFWALLAAMAAAQHSRSDVPIIPTPDLSPLAAEPVARIIDGDTIAVMRGGQEVKVRLIGVDTPETVDPRKPVEAYGKEASRFTTNLLQGEKVYLVKDPTKAETTDRYGRLLAFVYRAPDGLFVNAEIIRQGYGHAYTQFPFRYMEEFRALERFAREAGKGLWGEVQPVTATPPGRRGPLYGPTPGPGPRRCACAILGPLATYGGHVRAKGARSGL
ncbi:MAG TPA: thermonuclease family protein, partial [Phycisphaerae bacterium]|nr:thermonuclease family protein [Phycisphaerae bacterium]